MIAAIARPTAPAWSRTTSVDSKAVASRSSTHGRRCHDHGRDHRLVPRPASRPTVRAVAAGGASFVEFFAAQIANDHTRKTYLNATRRFAAWYQAHALDSLTEVQPFNVAASIQHLRSQVAPPTMKQRLAQCGCC
jgi:hypothetical protein